MKTRKWIWLLTFMVITAIVLPLTVLAEGEIVIWAGSSDAKYNSAQLEYTGEATVANWGAMPQGIVDVVDGKVTAIAAGTARVDALDEYNNTLQSWDILVNARAVLSLRVTHDPDTTKYIATQEFKPDGLVVEVTYNNGETESISDTSKFTYSPSGQLGAGDTTITVSYGDKTTTVGIEVAERDVSSFEIKDDRKEFTVGDTLGDIKTEVTYNDGRVEIISYGTTDYTIEPSVTTPLKETDKSYTVTYKYNGKEYTRTKEISVKAKDYTLEYVSGTKPDKTAYKVGDKFDATGIVINIKQGSNVVKKLEKSDLTNAFNYTFKESDIGKSPIRMTLSYLYDGKTLTGNYDFSGLTITANKSALDLYEIVNVEMMKTAYPVGYRFTVDDIDFIQYTLTRSGSVKKLYSEDFDKYSEDIDLEVLTLNSRGNVTTKSSTSSYLRTIQEADVQTSSKGSKYVTLRVYVGDEDFDVDVSIGDLGGVSVYYGNTLLTYYEDIMEALDAIDEGDSALTSYSTRTSGTYNIRLGEDQKVTRNYSDYDPERYISIDLNGYNLTFYTTTIGVSSRNKYSVSVTNTSSTTSKFEYYDLDQTLLVDKGETLIFDSDLARDEVPGIYTVKIADTKNGKVTAKPEANKNTNAVTIAHGNDITFTITPDEGYQIDTVKLGTTTVSTTSTSNKDYTVNATTGAATYTMKNVIKDGQTLTATFKVIEKKEEPKAAWTNPFTDISTRATYYDDVRFVNQNGLMNGMTATTFSPSSNMTRAQFVTTLGRMYFSDYKTTEDKDAAVLRIYGTASEFKDVDYDNYNDRDIKYAIPYINWATANGLILGYGDGTFGPRDNITHQQMYIIMYRYATSLAKQTPNVSRVTLSIPDADKIGMTLVGGTWQYWTDAAREGALTAAKYAQQQQFLVSSGAMDPTGDAYRYELATLLHRFSVNVLGWKD